MSNPSLLILAGDGIGPEVMAQVRRIIDWFGTKRGLNFDVSEDLVGGAAYDAHGTPLTDETMAKAQEADAVLLGAVGGPKYDALDFSVKPERGCTPSALTTAKSNWNPSRKLRVSLPNAPHSLERSSPPARNTRVPGCATETCAAFSEFVTTVMPRRIPRA